MQEGPGALHDQGRDRLRPAGHRVDKNGKPAADKTFKTVSKKFVEEDNSRLLQAWEYCGKRSRKGKKQQDMEDFLVSFGDYMEARNDVAKTAREEAARMLGQPLAKEKEKKKARRRRLSALHPDVRPTRGAGPGVIRLSP